MARNDLKVAICTLMVGILIAMSATLVFAASVSSPYGYYGPILGYSYKNQAKAYTGTGDLAGVWAYACVYSEDGNVPTGYMGARARLYNSSGSLVKSSSWVYNDEPLSGMSIPTDIYKTKGTYYSKGLTAAYNGDGYTTYYTFQSPNITY